MLRWLRRVLTDHPARAAGDPKADGKDDDNQGRLGGTRGTGGAGGELGLRGLSEPFLDEAIAGTLGQAKFSLGMLLRQQGITHSDVLKVMLDEVPRERFVMPSMVDQAYENVTLPIGLGQTISAPYIVALMSQLLEPSPGKAVLEIGTGCGYQAAVLSRLFGHVYSIERHEDLADTAIERLRHLDCSNVSVHLGDGFLGLPDSAPFDGIILTAAPREVPPALVNQLALGGRLVLPLELKTGEQFLMRYTKSKAGLFEETFVPVRFVPMLPGIPAKNTGQATEISHESETIESPKVDSTL